MAADGAKPAVIALTKRALLLAGLLVMAYAEATLGLVLGRILMGVGAGVAVPAARRHDAGQLIPPCATG